MGRRSLAADAGRLLRTVREARGLSQARLAERAGISQQRLSKLERGAADPRLGDLECLFAGMRLQLRLETVPESVAMVADPDLLLREPEEERLASVAFQLRLLAKLQDVPHVLGGRLAAFAHGLPIRVHRIDVMVAHDDRPRFALALRRFGAVRWSERWQEFRDHSPAERPGPMRWLISGLWELRVPPLPWLEANDPDVAELRGRLSRAGWVAPAGWPGGG
jgi:transcriptional regulator with XRE-family HTH domain